MTWRRVLTYVAVALPPLVLAAFGAAHVTLIPVLPLLAFAPWLVIRGYDAFLTVLVVLLSLVYAVLFTGSLVGLGANLGFIGSVAFIAACAVTGLAGYRRYGLLTVPGAIVLVVGAFLFLQEHVSWPIGVIAQVMIAVGWCGILVAIQRYRPDAKPFPTDSASKAAAETGKRQTKSSQK